MIDQSFSKVLILVILAILISGGILTWQYWSVPEEKVEILMPETPEEEVVPEKEPLKETTEKEIDKCKDIQDLDKKDECYFSLGLETKEAYYCQRVSSWYGLVSSRNCLKCLAAFKNDLNLCPEREFCPKYVFLQNTELCSDIEIDMIAMCRNCYLGDLTGPSCNLEESKIDNKEKCIKNVAIETEDFELCKKIDTGVVKYCQDELAIKLNKPEMCDSTSCLDELAVKNKNVKLCDNRKDCILSVALSSNDSSLCKELSEKEFQEECYRDFGIEIGKKGSCELCEEIPNPIAKRYCMLKVTATSDDCVFCEGLDINIEDLIAKYTDEEFGFSFYYPKLCQLSEKASSISLKGVNPYGDPYGDWITITKYTGQRVEDSDAKFGKVAYYYDEDKKQWMKDAETDYESGVLPTEAGAYTISGLPIFSGVGRWATRIVALSTDKFLIINITGSGWTRILDPLTKTVIKIDQKVEDKEVKKILVEEILSLEEIF